MGFFAKRKMEKILEGKDEATNERVANISGSFADYVSKYGMKLSYDPSDKQFKPSRDSSNYDAVYITPFDAYKLDLIIANFRGLRDPGPNADITDKIAYLSNLTLGIKFTAEEDPNKQLTYALKSALGYPETKPLDIIIPNPIYDFKSAKICDNLFLILDKKETYTGKEYNPYLLSIKKYDGKTEELTKTRKFDGTPIEISYRNINLPNSDKRLDKYFPSKNGNATSKSLLKLISADLPWYKLGLAIETFLDDAIARNAPMDSKTREEFINYLNETLK